jgi:branched-chain amino acid transport system permease protein
MDEKQYTTGQKILRFGFLGGVIVLYLTTIGLVEVFSERNLLSTWISLGQIFLIAGSIAAGFLVARAVEDESSPALVLAGTLGVGLLPSIAIKDKSKLAKVGAGLIAGAISSIPLILLIFIIEFFVVRTAGQESIFKLREMFVNFSPNLLDILTFGQGLGLGTLLRIIASALLGALGAIFVILPSRWGRAILNGAGWTLGLGLFSENVSQVVTQLLGHGAIKFIFQNKSLNPLAGAFIFIVAFLFSYFRTREGVSKRYQSLPPQAQKRGRLVFLVLGVIFLVVLPWIMGLFLSQALFIISLYVMMGLGLNIVVGYAGLLDLGYVAFFAFGAYTMGILTSTGPLGRGELSFWIALPISALAGVLWGFLLGFPVLRMRGDYLAIVTLGFGEIIRILATSNWLAPIEGGPQGVLHIPNPVFFGIELDTPQKMYYLVVAGSLLAIWVSIRLRDSRLGRQWMAMREDEDVAEAMGINLVQTKLLAFALGGAFSAMAGGIFAARLGNIFPHSFNLLISINALCLIIVGGIGSIPGVIVGAAILAGLPELLREFSEYRLLMYGILLIVMMLYKPEGFLPEATRKRELHAGEEFQESVVLGETES